jgi:hypothetical protein
MAGDLVILFRFTHRTKRWEPDTVSTAQLPRPDSNRGVNLGVALGALFHTSLGVR